MSAPDLFVCSPVRPAAAAPFDPRWRTETVVLLARGIAADDALDRLPILSDALEDAGCDCPHLLRHLRECEHHTPACWVLSDVLERLAVAPDAPRLTDAEVRRAVEEVTGRPVDPSSDYAWDGRFLRDLRFWNAVPPRTFAVMVALALAAGLAFGLGTACRPRPHTPKVPTVGSQGR